MENTKDLSVERRSLEKRKAEKSVREGKGRVVKRGHGKNVEYEHKNIAKEKGETEKEKSVAVCDSAYQCVIRHGGVRNVVVCRT